MTIKSQLTASIPICSSSLITTIVRVAIMVVILFTPNVSSADISGIWKHTTEASWIKIQHEEGIGTVERNDKFPEGVGRQILKDLVQSKSDPTVWHGMIYIRKLGEYKRVEISLSEADRMEITGKVGFISRTVEWVRVDKTP